MSAAPPIRIGLTSTLISLGPASLAAAHAAHMQGAEFFYFKEQDVDLASETILGRFYVDGRWMRRRTAFPDVIENVTTEPLTSDIWTALIQRCRITSANLGGKAAVDRVLRSSGRFDQILVPTAAAESPDQIVEQLSRHKQIVVKPDSGFKGRGIVYVAEQDGAFLANLEGTNHHFDLAGLKVFLAERMSAEPQMVQQYVASRTALGQPFDLRIHIRRDGNAQWRGVYTMARIGSGATIAANFATGGSLADGKAFIEHRFGAEANIVWARVMHISRHFPDAFQSLFPKTTIPALGIDIGFDEQGHPRLFEVNLHPSTQFATFPVHMWRMGYAIYLVKNPDVPDGVVRDA